MQIASPPTQMTANIAVQMLRHYRLNTIGTVRLISDR